MSESQDGDIEKMQAYLKTFDTLEANGVTVSVAAIKTPNGVVWAVPRPGRHSDVNRIAIRSGVRLAEGSVQGFVLSSGRFVDRLEAAKIALAAGQIEEPTDVLYSEHLW